MSRLFVFTAIRLILTGCGRLHKLQTASLSNRKGLRLQFFLLSSLFLFLSVSVCVSVSLSLILCLRWRSAGVLGHSGWGRVWWCGLGGGERAGAAGLWRRWLHPSQNNGEHVVKSHSHCQMHTCIISIRLTSFISIRKLESYRSCFTHKYSLTWPNKCLDSVLVSQKWNESHLNVPNAFKHKMTSSVTHTLKETIHSE